MMRKLGALAFTALAVTAAPTQAQTVIQYGVVARVAIQWQEIIATETGLFAKYGVKPEVSNVGASPKVVQGLAGGTFNIGESGMPEVVRATEQGAPVKIIAAEMAAAPYRWNVGKNITKVEDLKGKKIMLGGQKDITVVYLEAVAKKHNLKMTDFDFLYAGSTSNRFAALVGGAIDCTLLAQPFDLQAERQGFKSVATQKDYTPDAPFTAYAANTDWAAKNQKAVAGFVRATMDAAAWLYDVKNRDAAIKTLVNVGAKPEDAQATYDLYTSSLKPFRTDGVMTDAAITYMLKALVAWDEMKEPLPPTSKYYDDTYVKLARGL
jgi:NitT/TauT family transport system substrate-binding protein